MIIGDQVFMLRGPLACNDSLSSTRGPIGIAMNETCAQVSSSSHLLTYMPFFNCKNARPKSQACAS